MRRLQDGMEAMKEKQETNIRDWLQEEHDRIEKEQPVVEVRYYVVEVTPSHRYSDEYDSYWSKEVSTRVSEYASSEEELQTFLDKYEPDKGNEFQIRKQNKRAQPPKWVNY